MCILLTEDDTVVRMNVQEALQDVGYEVVAADDAFQALGEMARHPNEFRALVTDYVLPFSMTGGELIEQMRQVYPRIPMILTSAYLRAIPVTWQTRYEVTYLAKPYVSNELINLLSQLLADDASSPAFHSRTDQNQAELTSYAAPRSFTERVSRVSAKHTRRMRRL